MGKLIQLRHPAGKKAVRMDEEKYEAVKKILLNCLKKKGELSHTEILQALVQDFKKRKIKFQGSMEWHMEWVKLDLEAHKIIQRIPGSTGIRFRFISNLSG